MKFLFDLGGVFFDWDPNYFFKDIFEKDDERKYFLTEVCNDEWNIQQDAGRTIKEAESVLIPKFPQYEKEIKMYYSNHRRMIKGTFTSSIKVLDKLKKQNYLICMWLIKGTAKYDKKNFYKNLAYSFKDVYFKKGEAFKHFNEFNKVIKKHIR